VVRHGRAVECPEGSLYRKGAVGGFVRRSRPREIEELLRLAPLTGFEYQPPNGRLQLTATPVTRLAEQPARLAGYAGRGRS